MAPEMVFRRLHHKAARLLAQGEKRKPVCEKIGRSMATLESWLSKPEFRILIEEYRKDPKLETWKFLEDHLHENIDLLQRFVNGEENIDKERVKIAQWLADRALGKTPPKLPTDEAGRVVPPGFDQLGAEDLHDLTQRGT